MISEDYMNYVDMVCSLGYSEYQPLELLRMIDVGFAEMARSYILKDLATVKEDAIYLASYGYGILERRTGKSLEELSKEAKDLHKRKNAGYSGNNNDPWINFRASQMFGIDPIDGILTRLTDKYMRLKNVWINSELEQVNEAIEDTLMDFSAYLLILCCLIDEKETE